MIVVIPKGQSVSLADLEAQVRRENGLISPKNIVIASNDSGTCVTDIKYRDNLDFITQKLDKLDLLETLAKEVAELETSVEICHGSIYEKGESQHTENHSETKGGRSTAESRERNRP